MKEPTAAEALYGFTIPVFIRTLENASKILAVAERHARRHKIAPETLLSARLYPNMYTLLQQLQYLCFLPVDFAQHFSSAAAPHVGYDEKTLDEIKTSFKQTLKYLRSIKPDRFEGQEQRLLPLFFDASKGLPADALAQRLTLPDFFFHTTVAYAILRHIGVPLDWTPCGSGRAGRARTPSLPHAMMSLPHEPHPEPVEGGEVKRGPIRERARAE